MDLQDAANWTIPEGEVRNLHDKDNRLLWSAVGYNVRYDGDTTQQTYSGKNLMPMSEAVMDDNNRLWNFTVTFPAGTYTISFTLDSFELGTNTSFTIYSQIYTSSGYKDINITSPDNITSSTTPGQRYSCTVTFSDDVVATQNSNIRIPNLYWNNGARASISQIQIEKGSPATSYEPYVGGTPSPNPDYPQDVNVVTGEQDVLVSAKNLLSVSFVVSGGVPSDIPTNTFVLDRENQRFFRCDFPTLLPPGTYTISFDISNNNTLSGVNFTLFGKTEATILHVTQISRGSTSSHYSGTFTINEDIKIIRWFIASNEANDKHATISNVQVEAGSTETAYQMYQGQHVEQLDLGSIELCKIGNYQDYIFKSIGKNLLGVPDGINDSNGIHWTRANNVFHGTGTLVDETWSNVLPAVDVNLPVGTYTFSVANAIESPLQIEFSTWDNDNTRHNYRPSVGETSITKDFPNGLKKVSIAIVHGTINTQYDITFSNPQLEKGSTATPYEPYGTDWYVYKETGKTVLNGSEDWSGGGTATSSQDCIYVYTDLLDSALDALPVQPYALCSHFTNYGSVLGNSATINQSVFSLGTANSSSKLRFFVRKEIVTSKAEWLTWLGGHNVGAYYRIATPTYTKITDATLLSQLNAIHNWLTRYDYYGLVSGDLPIIINKTEIT